jgi:hypothetical protein
MTNAFLILTSVKKDFGCGSCIQAVEYSRSEQRYLSCARCCVRIGDKVLIEIRHTITSLNGPKASSADVGIRLKKKNGHGKQTACRGLYHVK